MRKVFVVYAVTAVCLGALGIATLVARGQSRSTTWNVAIGGESVGHGVQAIAYEPLTITIHAGDTRGSLDRFCQLIEEAVPRAPRALVAQTIHLCVHIQRDPLHPAGRRVSGIDRVLGLADDGSWLLEPCTAPNAPSTPSTPENT